MSGIIRLYINYENIGNTRNKDTTDLKTDRREIAYESYKPMKIISGIIQRKYKEINDFSKQTKVFSPYVSQYIYAVSILNNVIKIIEFPFSHFVSLTY